MAATTKNLKDLLPAQNPRQSHKRNYPTHNVLIHTEVFLPSPPSSSQALSWSNRSYKQASSHPHSPCTEQWCPPQPSSSRSLSRPRLIASPHASWQQTFTSIMPLATSQETRSWLQQRGLGGYLRVIDAPTIARRIHPDTVTNNMIRAALDLARGGDHEVEIPPHSTLKEYFGMYSMSGKAYRTYGGPIKAFGEIARILMEYAFVHTNPTIMP